MSNLPQFVLSSPEAVEQFRQIARSALEREGELSPILRQQLEQRARELKVHPVDMERVLQEVLDLPSVRAVQARRVAEQRAARCPRCYHPVISGAYFCTHCGTVLRQDYIDTFVNGYVIAEPCIGVNCGDCAEVCPVECISAGGNESSPEPVRQFYIDPDTCIECGACVPECPVDAIRPIQYLPDSWKYFAEKNADWFRLPVEAFISKWGGSRSRHIDLSKQTR